MPLRSLRASDVASITAWLPAIASAIGCERWSSEDALSDAIERKQVLLYHDDAGEAFVAYALDAPKRGAARIELLAVAPDNRRLGIAGRAALALERRLTPAAKRIYVAVPSTIGLALYFWLRLGYRPLTQRDWPELLEGASTWMVRELR
jgi:ribosomal protein S18 acetylase RimI-like enzyme